MKKKTSRRGGLFREERRAAWGFLAPSLLGVGLLVLAPFGETVRRSFFNNPGTRFVGLKNYRSVVENSAFRLAMENTGTFMLVCVPLLLLISLILGLMVRSLGARGWRYKTTFLLPMAIPVASVVLLWQVLFSDRGLANAVLIGMGAEPVGFMGTHAAFGVLVFTYLWKNTGYDTILWLSGMDGIPQALYEAAAVDGANGFQQFWYVTLPGLAPTLSMLSVLSLLNTFKVFREAYLVAGRYPHDSIYLLQHLFNNWFRDLDLGRLTAGAVLMAMGLLAGILLLGWLLEGRKAR